MNKETLGTSLGIIGGCILGYTFPILKFTQDFSTEISKIIG